MIASLTLTSSKTAQYAFAVLVVILASLLRDFANPILGEKVPFILFYPTVVLAAWFGGLGPGLLATVLSGFIAWYVFYAPYILIGTFGSLRVRAIDNFFARQHDD